MLLSIDKLNTGFYSDTGYSQVLHDVSLQIDTGQTVALVGESGSGKSVTALSLLRLLEESATKISGRIEFEEEELLAVEEERMRQIRGNRIAMIFQEPMTSLNPVYPIGTQLMEPLILHQKFSQKMLLW